MVSFLFSVKPMNLSQQDKECVTLNVCHIFDFLRTRKSGGRSGRYGRLHVLAVRDQETPR